MYREQVRFSMDWYIVIGDFEGALVVLTEMAYMAQERGGRTKFY